MWLGRCYTMMKLTNMLCLDLTAMMVPESCCAKDQYGNYYIKQQCQNWQVGPPNIQTGVTNEALHYKVCIRHRTRLTFVTIDVTVLHVGQLTL